MCLAPWRCWPIEQTFAAPGSDGCPYAQCDRMCVRTGEHVATPIRRGRSSGRPRAPRKPLTIPGARTRIGKVRKAFWLDPRLLDEARASLGASNEREAVEMALEMV